MDDVRADLEEQGLEPIKVTRMTSSRSKKPLPLVLIEVPKDKGAIFYLKAVCHLSVTVEQSHKKGTPSQCHRCQRFHHSQRHCHALLKCCAKKQMMMRQNAQIAAWLTPRAIGDAPSSPGVSKPKNLQVQRHPNRNKNPPRPPETIRHPPQHPSRPQPQKPAPRPKPRPTTTRQKASRTQPRLKRPRPLPSCRPPPSNR
jgi:hypothetical protein